MNIKFLPLGGANEIGASCFYVNIEGTGVILDCGMHPQKTGLDALPKFELIKDSEIDYVLVSHAHQDHLSALPFLVKLYPYIKIIATPQTRALAELTLHNSVSILKQQLSEYEELKIFSHEEIDLLVQTIEYQSYNNEFIINGYNHKSSDDLTAELFDAGHILGSTSILLKINDKKIFYTGDINLNNQALIKGASIPNENVDLLIIETTYGSTDSSTLNSWEKEANNLASSINSILNDGGSVLIPVFSLGKQQEILTTLWQLIQKRKLTFTEIYTGGIGNKINRVYDYNRFVVNMKDPEFEISSIPTNNLYEVKSPEDFFKHPCIVLASSGMMIEGTASYNLAKRWIRQSDSAIFMVGYMEENTPGYKFSKAIKGGKIKLKNDKEEEVKCTIKNFKFSAHSNREELLNIVEKLEPKNVILVHGDPPAIDWIGASIIKGNKNIKVYSPEIGKEIQLSFDG
ncbi:MAG: MBL fold metallo-hydrolase [Ignavibacteriaceae bacterium]